MIKTAILVDGGFYRKRAYEITGFKYPKPRALELYDYCQKHINDVSADGEKRILYRILYYDCKPSDKQVFHPFLQQEINLRESRTYEWTNEFFKALTNLRKVALRFGALSAETAVYKIRDNVLVKLCKKEIDFKDLTEKDFILDMDQKGVDMRIGLDIASLAYKRLVDQLILIAGDSDFIPVAKLARREGIDVIIDPMGAHIKDTLNEHVDGLKSYWRELKCPTPNATSESK